MPKGYFIQKSKKEFMQVNKTLFSEKRQGAFSRDLFYKERIAPLGTNSLL